MTYIPLPTDSEGALRVGGLHLQDEILTTLKIIQIHQSLITGDEFSEDDIK